MNESTASRVLLLAPKDDFGEFLRTMLHAVRRDDELILASRPDEALKMIGDKSCEVAVAEGIDGVTFIQAVSDLGLNVPVIFIAPDEESELLDQARVAGASEAIFRSELTPAALQHALHYALLWRALDAGADNSERKSRHSEIVGMGRTESLARLASSIAHEVRNPLSLMLLAADYLDKPRALTDKAKADIVHYLRHGANRIEEIMSAMLSACAPKQLMREAHDPVELVEEALRLVDTRLPGDESIRIIKDYGDGMPAVFVDRNRMVEAILHLLTNAVDAMPGGGTIDIKVRVHTFLSSERADWQREAWFRAGDVAVIIEISDTGHGIPEDKLGQIFDIFFTTKTAGKGAGLGLAAAKKIIDLHNGRIAIVNRPGGGAVATLTLKTAATRTN
jgi:signal transduction histidine kinase